MESNYFNVDYVLQFIDSPIIISIQNFLCTICVGDHMVDIIPELLVNDELTCVQIMTFRQGVKKTNLVSNFEYLLLLRFLTAAKF